MSSDLSTSMLINAVICATQWSDRHEASGVLPQLGEESCPPAGQRGCCLLALPSFKLVPSLAYQCLSAPEPSKSPFHIGDYPGFNPSNAACIPPSLLKAVSLCSPGCPEIHCVDQAGLLPLPLRCWDSRQVPWHQATLRIPLKGEVAIRSAHCKP